MKRTPRALRTLLLAVALAAHAALADPAAAQDHPAGQLPAGVAPTHYTLDLTVRPDRETFSGRVAIDIALDAPTDVIWLHGQGLAVREARVTDADGAAIAAAWTEIPDSDGVAKLALARTARGPAARITIAYDAPFDRRLEGLYRADEGGESYAYSQMETIFARRAFPGFDEPRFKTPYDIAMTVRAADTAVSNAPVAKEARVAGGLKKVTFATTKPLPTYLVALIAGPFDVVEGPPIPPSAVRDRPVPLRGITAKGKGGRIRYALDNTPAILGALENYFGTPYPYEKLDIVAVTDFAYGAMENAGAITYREQLLLMDETAALAQKRRYALVHAHELAHQWFGNLVTPAWWNDIWLNEAFATWMGNKAAAAWDPDGEFGRLTLRGALEAMGADSSHAARAIAQPILSNDDIQNAFDGITYDKGGGVLAMFERFYGAENFRKGIALHLERKAWGVATAREFLQSVADANNDTAGVAAFESFLNQPGVPLVTARLACDGPVTHLEVRQDRYFQSVPDAAGARPAARWTIPMCVAYGTGAGRDGMCVVLDQPETRIVLETPSCPAWVMPNADGAGYFRFAFDDAGWDALARGARALAETEAIALLDSLEASFIAGGMGFDKYIARLRTVFAARNAETGGANTGGAGTGVTWDMAEAVLSRLSWFDDMLLTDASRPRFRAIVAELYGPLYAALGLDAAAPLDRSHPARATLLRAPVVRAMAAEARDPAVRAELARRGAAYLGAPGDGRVHPEVILPDLLDEALRTAAQENGAPFVRAALAHLEGERDGTVRQRLLSAVTRATDPAAAREVRAHALSGDLRVNEVSMLMYGMMAEPGNRADAWAWFKQNFEALKARTPPNNRAGLLGVGAYFCDAAARADYEGFFKDRIGDISGAPRAFAAALGRIGTCAALVEKQRPVAEAFLAAPSPGP